MGVTNIEWCHYTFNHVRGCTKVSEGCANCYADKLSGRNPKTLGVWGPNGTRVVAAESGWREPVKWNAAAKAAGERHRVFCASLADVFEDWTGPMLNSQGEKLFVGNELRPTEWFSPGDDEYALSTMTRIVAMSDVRRRLFELIDDTPHLDWLLLTKRPENVLKMWRNVARAVTTPDINYTTTKWVTDDFTFRPNVWLGVSVENQEQADKRIPLLLQVPAAVRFLSCEPLLGPVDLRRGVYHQFDDTARGTTLEGIDWVIVGGESGHGARPIDISWVRSIVEQCKAAGVPCFVKQLGANVLASDAIDPIDQFPNDVIPGFSQGPNEYTARIHFLHPKGGDIAEWPENLRVREFPL